MPECAFHCARHLLATSAHVERYLLLPADPYNAKILSPVERDLAVWRIERETGAAEGSGPTESVVRSFLLHCCGFF